MHADRSVSLPACYSARRGQASWPHSGRASKCVEYAGAAHGGGRGKGKIYSW
jgi:hypothetical protein